jgi:hypothetical protein
MYPVLDLRLPRSRTTDTVLTQYHPERRYAVSPPWDENDARKAVGRAEQVYDEIIPGLRLDGLI